MPFIIMKNTQTLMQYLYRGSKIILLSFGANENAFFEKNLWPHHSFFMFIAVGMIGFPDSQNKALGKNRAKMNLHSLERFCGELSLSCQLENCCKCKTISAFWCHFKTLFARCMWLRI